MKNKVKISGVFFTLLLLLIFFSCKKEAVKTAPVVSITTPSGITANSASSGGNVTADGGSAVTGKGVCWSTGSNPTMADSRTLDGVAWSVDFRDSKKYNGRRVEPNVRVVRSF